MDCPCKSHKPYKDCCKPYHDKEIFPESALDLMRSRYSAYALKKIDYIIETTDQEGPLYQKDHRAWVQDLTHFATTTAFQDLTIIGSQSLSKNEATVTFFARLQSITGQDTSFTETSLFRRKKGRWYYHSRS